ncbi:uncharacterized protein LOC123501349 [Portunus trituberculatus]|uniref:uncharacterized protein LOC123501349 n=1 Tax=Portunus trituberculatus TaxID=210409 RepID=UPI001E1D11E6|nr:uncharacterized protein LOC123501349 [Portunus trituberculatus]
MTPQGYSPLLSSPGLAVVLAGLMELSLLPLLHASSHSSLSDTALHFDALGIPGRGVGGRDYPLLATVPETGFSCAARRSPGYYADTSTAASCQVFHVCQADGRHHAFLCPNGTIFSQRALVCDWWFNVQCFESLSHQDAITPLKSQRAPFKSQRLPQTPARVTRHPNVFPATPTPSHHQSSHPSSPTPSHSHSYRAPQQSHSHGSSQSNSSGHSQLNHSLPQHTVTSGSHNASQFTVSQSVNSLPQFTVSLPSHSLPHFTSSQAGSHPHSLNQLSSHSQSQSPISQSTSHTLPQLKVTSSHSSSHSQSQSPVSQSTSHTLPQLKITSQPQSPVTQHLDIPPLFREDVSSLAGKTRLQEPHAKMRRGPLPFRTPGINQHIDQPILDPVSLGSNSQESNFISGLPPLREGERVEYDQIYSATIFPPNIPPLGDVYEAAKGRVVVRVVKESGENALSGVLQSVGSSRSLPLASFHKQGISKKPHASQIVTVSNGAIKGSSQGDTLTSHVIEKPIMPCPSHNPQFKIVFVNTVLTAHTFRQSHNPQSTKLLMRHIYHKPSHQPHFKTLSPQNKTILRPPLSPVSQIDPTLHLGAQMKTHKASYHVEKHQKPP